MLPETVLRMGSCRSLAIFTLPILLILLQMLAIQGSNSRLPSASGHEMPNVNRTELSPSAMEFFGPSAETEEKHPFSDQSRAGEPMAEPSEAGESLQHSSRDLSKGAVAGIAFSVLFVVVFAVGGSYVYVKRRANMRRANFMSSLV